MSLDAYDRRMEELEKTKVKHLRRIADSLEAIANGALVPQKHLVGLEDAPDADTYPVDADRPNALDPWTLRYGAGSRNA